MELFFDREGKRLEFVGERNQMREQQKKEMDDKKIQEQEVHALYMYIDYASHFLTTFNNTCTYFFAGGKKRRRRSS